MSAVAAALAALAAGRPVLVADDAAREDEVDVVLAARDADAATVAWVVRHSSGYLCAPMPAARADALDLPLMVARNEDSLRTAYTVSVDAASGVGTGISAADRARTLRVLADPDAAPGDLVRPGHVLPLRARPGGVLERPGHTEAAVDLVRLAGRGEVGLIAELVHDDGRMVRRDDARRLAEAEGLVLLTVAELVAWRREHDPAGAPSALAEPGEADEQPDERVAAVAEAALPTRHGAFRLHAFRDRRTGAEHVALVAAPPDGPGSRGPGAAPLVRVHSECLTGDALGSLRCDCGPQLEAALARVAAHGGAVVYLGGHEGRGIGLAAKVAAYALQDAGMDTVAANVHLGLPVDAREYGAAAAILRALGLGRVTLLTNNPQKVAGLRRAGVDVAATAPLEVGHGAHNHRYLLTKKTAMGHRLALAAPADARPAPTLEEESA
ncbi:3,4-dihydroxy-2-butanone-4-phosphate synthase [Puerhibacterium puerhi]|uniref:3,4-dihydroxy-2-butanone-4-phosphate synthase n=1 Tax=Puerhibacterium puerhi TaxID=2692623 RepID=UPI0013589824|nr:3,4-dihydroxy-2-butanone-4-phosphate synthase [Puerhibacterium puerhi]